MTRGRAILVGTTLVGVLDALDAIVVFGLRSGVTPVRIFQSIAAGLFGSAVYTGGYRTALVGLLLHFTIACGVVVTYIVVSARVPVLRRRPWVFGPIYGITVYLVMNLIVIPLSAIGGTPFSMFTVVNGVLIHICGVGLPTALVARRIASPGV